MDRLLRRDEVAELLAVSESTVYRLGVTGELREVRVTPQNVRYRPEDIEAFIRREAGNT